MALTSPERPEPERGAAGFMGMLDEDELLDEGTGNRVDDALPAPGFTFVPTLVRPDCEVDAEPGLGAV